ncbi:hypothetical protein K432DRAFT_426830 [Lepidopterella palustris CBS 459.81]|uniref:Protein kinase domain-containing protein n=1 Tax=Lepidopterella palustris CBS 459.81 TaxID=1314670 RepID=A0A8E2E871_9PEZI|nr:hypothetical protein K432DRAFT_426830 [Lepidopterella palustris CBS 459.81]
MASGERKRDKRFPGSDLFSSLGQELTLPRNSKNEATKVPEVPKLNSTKRKRLEVPQLNSPINFPPPNPSPPYKEGSIPTETSPWEHYERAYDIELGGSVTRVSKIPEAEDVIGGSVIRVSKIPETEDMFTLRSFSNSDTEKLDLLSHFKHKNILTTYEVFPYANKFYVISEDTEVSLEEFIIARPDEVQLAAITSQVLDAIIYFATKGLVHGGITCSNIVLTKKGVVKIANLENCSEIDSKNRRSDVQALGKVMQQLMENGTEDRRLGLRDPSSWSKDAVDFLSLTMTETAKQLSKHPFFEKGEDCKGGSIGFLGRGFCLSILQTLT